MTIPDKHLDLGCGKVPRNPYGRSSLCGVDIRPLPSGEPVTDFDLRVANVAVQPIPYGDNMFGSVSAFDFIEHVPRIIATSDGRETIFPFINLMNEIWRVLAAGGRLYAVTPAFPSPEVFVDPTHVNVITAKTHEYFCGDAPLGRMYGFSGNFRIINVEWVRPHHLAFTGAMWDAECAMQERTRSKNRQLTRRIAYGLRETLRFLRRKRGWQLESERKTHLLWEFEAVKPA